MAIDGIGGGPGGIGGPKIGPAQSAGKSGAEFQLDRADAAAPTGDVGSADVQRLERGELSLDEYLDARAEQAVAHLQGMAPEQLEVIKAQLVEQLKSDPAISGLVRRATGVASANVDS